MLLSGFNDNPKLTNKGIKQAHDTKKKLAHIKFDTAYSSDLTRAIHTGSIIYGKQVPSKNQLRALRERGFGSVELNHQDVVYRAHKLIENLSPDEKWRYNHFPGMESDHTLSQRYIEALEDIARQESNKTVLIASHGSAMRTTIRVIDSKGYSHLGPGSLENGAFVVLEYNKGKFKVIELQGLKNQNN